MGLGCSTPLLQEKARPSACWGRRAAASACVPSVPPLKAVAQGSSDSQILDLSNRFYTLIPHDFGMKKPPLLNNTDSVQVARSCGRGLGPRDCGASAGRAASTPWAFTHTGGDRPPAEQVDFPPLLLPHRSGEKSLS